ncbi:MAG TPA: tetratricopeptide repeat protein [Candidatus Obscuribacterales bacterium]
MKKSPARPDFKGISSYAAAALALAVGTISSARGEHALQSESGEPRLHRATGSRSSHSAQKAKAAVSPPNSSGKLADDPELLRYRRLVFDGEDKKCLEVARARAKTAKNAAGWYELAALAIMMSKHGQALAFAEKAYSLAPDDANVLATLARAVSGRSPARALALADRALALSPNSGRVRAIAADCYARVGSGGEAEGLFVSAIKLSPGDFEVNSLAASFFERMLNFEQVEGCYNRLIKNYPRCASAYVSRALFRRGNGELKGAISDMSRAIELRPDEIAFYGHRGKLLAKDGQNAKAIEDFTKLLSGWQQGTAYGRRAECYKKLGKYTKAIDDYSTALKLIDSGYRDDQKFNPPDNRDQEDYLLWWTSRAQLYEKVGKIDLAIHSLSQMVNREGSTAGLLERERLYRKAGRYDLALADLNRLIAQDRDVAELYRTRADVYRKLGNKARADADIMRADQLDKTGRLP